MEASSVFYTDTASPAPPVTPSQGPQPAGNVSAAGNVGFGISNVGADHMPVFVMLALIGAAFLVIHLLD